jgi:hypothetical protein
LSETEEIDIAVFRGALPFVQRAPAASFFDTVNVARGRARESTHGAEDETLPIIQLVAPVAAATTVKVPPDGVSLTTAALGELPDLSVKQYASLFVELRRAPSEAAATLVRYRLAPEQRGPLDALWQRRLGSDPQLRSTFDSAVDAYNAWLAKTGR